MSDIVQWPVSPSRWLSQWRGMGGDVVGDKVVNPPFWPGLELNPAQEQRMAKLARQYNNPIGRQLIHAYIEGLNAAIEDGVQS